ncbi:hypothetical protein [Rhodococcus sp. T2V]|uniref:hypothetical protein n=1 Tax=Rhodococcus sp. T2V TaxID=3034164 RepID=UPI0034E30292
MHSTALGPAVGGTRFYPYPQRACCSGRCPAPAQRNDLQGSSRQLDHGGGSSPWGWCTRAVTWTPRLVSQAVKAGVTSPVDSVLLSVGLSLRERARTSRPR